MALLEVLQEAVHAQKRGDLQTAEGLYRKLLQSSCQDGRVWLGLGTVCVDGQRFVEAAACFRQSVELLPHEYAPRLQLANTLLKIRHYEEAEEHYRACLSLKPDAIDALVNRGYVLTELERLEEARECYQRALALDPQIPEIHHNLGNVLRDSDRFEEALHSYNEALRLRPDYPKALVNKGIGLVARGRLAEAADCAQRCVELAPDYAEGHNCLAHVDSARGDIESALAGFDRAIELKPDYSAAYWNRSLLWLIKGDYERGWPAYEWRFRCKPITPIPHFSQPRWDGSPLAGRTLLFHAEQGLGDTLHFVRYAPLIQRQGGRVIVQCQGSLIPLLSRCAGIDRLVPWGTPPPPFDVWLPFMSAPTVLRTTLETIPATIPYLHADPELVEHWRWELAALSGLRVGIAWQGNPRHPWDWHRSASRELFEPLSRIPGVHLINLQKQQEDEATHSSPEPFPMISLGALTDRAGAFTDTAAIMLNLDLVVTVDTAIAHLAGGLGVPVWIALHRTPDFRWLVDRMDSPWYPTARLFRQRQFGEWVPVFAQIAQELAAMASRGKTGPLVVEVSAGELLDKSTILQIKSERIRDPDKLSNVHRELQALERVCRQLQWTAELKQLHCELRGVNESLWDIENAIREHEVNQDYGPAFIQLARSVYLTNYRRAELKRRINTLVDSRLVEVKEYSGMAVLSQHLN